MGAEPEPRTNFDAEFDALLASTPELPTEALTLHSGHGAPSLEEFARYWDLYSDPVTAGILSGAVLGLLGVFVVLRRAVFVTAAVSQASGLGVAVAFLLALHTPLSLPPAGLAFVFGVGAALLGSAFPRAPREWVVGFTYLVTSVGSILVGDRLSQEAHDVDAILFGTAVLVSPEALFAVATVGLSVAGLLLLIRRGLLFGGLDREAARVQGLPVRELEVPFFGPWSRQRAPSPQEHWVRYRFSPSRYCQALPRSGQHKGCAGFCC